MNVDENLEDKIGQKKTTIESPSARTKRVESTEDRSLLCNFEKEISAFSLNFDLEDHGLRLTLKILYFIVCKLLDWNFKIDSLTPLLIERSRSAGMCVF